MQIHLQDLEFSYPHFPGEAIAEYYGSSQYDAKTKKLTTGLILEGRLTEVKNDIASAGRCGPPSFSTTWPNSQPVLACTSPKLSRRFLRVRRDLSASS